MHTKRRSHQHEKKEYNNKMIMINLILCESENESTHLNTRTRMYAFWYFSHPNINRCVSGF